MSIPLIERPSFNLLRGFARGIGESIFSLIGLPGLLIPGDDGFEQAERSIQRGLDQTLPITGTAAKVGQFGGRLVGEGAQVLVGGAGIIKGVAKVLPKAGATLTALLKGNILHRTVAQLAAFGPVDFVIGTLRGQQQDRNVILAGLEEAAIGQAGGFILGGAADVGGLAVKRLLRRSTPTPRLTDDEFFKQFDVPDEQIIKEMSEPSAADAAELLPAEKARLSTEGEKLFLQEVDRVSRLNPDIAQKRVTMKALERQAGKISFAELQGAVQPLTNAQLVAARNILNANVETMAKLSNKLKTSGFMSPDQRRAALRTLDGLFTQNDGLISKIVKARTEAGRTLNLFRHLSHVPEQTNSAIWLARAHAVGGDRVLTPDFQDTVVRLVRERDWPKLANLIDGLRQSTPREKVVAWVKAGWLSFPVTHMVNTTSTAASVVLETIKDVPGTAWDYLLMKATGQRTTTARLATKALGRGVLGRRRLPPVLGSRPGGGIRGATEVIRFGGVELGKLDLRAGEVHFRRFGDPGLWEALRHGRPVKAFNAISDIYLKTIFRLLSAEDQLFKGPIIDRALENQAFVRALTRGFKGKAARKEAGRIMSEELNDDMWVEALRQAEVATFQNPTFAGQAASAVGRGPFELIIPFKRTPGSIGTRILEFSPIGFLMSAGRVGKVLANPVADNIWRTQKEAVDVLGRATTGFGLIALGYYLADKGLAVGRGPEFGSAERNTFEAAGMQENSVLFNGQWENTGRLAPAGNLIALGAQMYDEISPDGGEAWRNIFSLNAWGTLAGEAVRTTLDLPFMQGVKQLQQFIEDPAGRAGKLFGGLATGLLPASAAVGGTARFIDPVVRDIQDPEGNAFLARIMSVLPGLSQGLPPKFNALGEELTRSQNVWGALLSPTKPREFDKRPEVRTLARLRVGIPRMKKLEGETTEEYQARLEGFRDILLPAVGRISEHESFKDLPVLWQRGVLEIVVDYVRRGVAREQEPQRQAIRARTAIEQLQTEPEQLREDPFTFLRRLGIR